MYYSFERGVRQVHHKCERGVLRVWDRFETGVGQVGRLVRKLTR